MLKNKWPLATLALLAPVTFIGCGGGGDSPSKTTSPTATPVPTTAPSPTNSSVATTTFVGLQSNGIVLVTFRGDRPDAATARSISGLPGGVSLRGIDARVAPSTNASSGTNGVSAIYGLGTNDQLYTLDLSGNGAVAATAVGSPAVFTDFTLGSGAYGFDVNPAADRLRVVSGTQNARINPNNGTAVDGDSTTTGTQPDGTLAYSSTDANAGQTPNVTAAAYTNNDANTGTSTVNYGVDSARGLLVTQGSLDGTVSPNTGTLFTVGSLGSNFSNNADVGLEIFGSNNTAVAVSGTTFYSVNLSSGSATTLGSIGSSSSVIDITVLI